jgi:hypothetical protein
MCTSDQSSPEGATDPVLRCTLGEFPSPLFNLDSFMPKLWGLTSQWARLYESVTALLPETPRRNLG